MANNFFIAYDLDAPGQDYRKIEAAINQCGDAIKIQLSLYYVKSKHTQAEIITHCWKAMDKNDRLLVIDAANATWENGLPGAKEFIQQRWNT